MDPAGTLTKRTITDLVLRDGSEYYHLLKVERRDGDIYGFIPGLGAHYSQHASGHAHMKAEKPTGTTNQPPIVLTFGAGEPTRGGLRLRSASEKREFGRADAVFTVWFPVNSPTEDYRSFRKRKTDQVVEIDRNVFGSSSEMIEIGVWTVSRRNTISFSTPGSPGSRPDCRVIFVDHGFDPETWVYVAPC